MILNETIHKELKTQLFSFYRGDKNDNKRNNGNEF